GADRLEDARLLLTEHDYAAAEVRARQVVQQPDGTDPALALRVVADALAADGQVDPALRVLRDIVDRYPNSEATPDALFRSGAILWNRDRDTEAFQAYDEFVRRYPQRDQAAEALYAIGRIREHGGHGTAAVDAYAELVRRYPENKIAGEARWRIGWIHYRARAWPAASAAFADLASRAASSRERMQAIYWQARALDEGGGAETAQALYRQIVRQERDDYYALWAGQHLGARGGLNVNHDAGADADPAPVALGAPPINEPFHLGRWNELKAAGVYSLARGELAAVERDHRDDP